MSRTYRLRHEPSLVAHKFADGNLRKYYSTKNDHLASAIVHGVFGYPCNAITPHTHFGGCLSQIIPGWGMRGQIILKLAGDRPLSIAPMYIHEYANHGRKARKMTHYGKHSVRQKVRRAVRDGDFEGDWDTELHDKPWSKHDH